MAAAEAATSGVFRRLGAAGSLARLLAAGADPLDLGEVERGMQYETLGHIAYLLHDPAPAFDDIQEEAPELEGIA
ncbi:MAG TPA: hypothetical protein VK841_16350 [Polyangiaceae bacterium]|nr:hypothetical protein [Polyangiaceae bacterium]